MTRTQRFTTIWNAAAPIVVQDSEIEENLKPHITFTTPVQPPGLLAHMGYAVLSLRAHIEQDRIEGPFTEDDTNLDKVRGRLAPDWDDHWENRWLKYAWVRRLLKKILQWDIHEEVCRAAREGRLYVKHYHATLDIDKDD